MQVRAQQEEHGGSRNAIWNDSCLSNAVPRGALATLCKRPAVQQGCLPDVIFATAMLACQFLTVLFHESLKPHRTAKLTPVKDTITARGSSWFSFVGLRNM